MCHYTWLDLSPEKVRGTLHAKSIGLPMCAKNLTNLVSFTLPKCRYKILQFWANQWAQGRHFLSKGS